jgi:hypothetical protein
MNRPGHDNTRFFLGTEVEHTPALGMKTLFVIGVQPVQDIDAMLNDAWRRNCQANHVYFGANHSFPGIPVNNGADWGRWEHMIYHCLERGLWCTLDVDVSCVEGLLESGLVEHRRFIPMISVKMPYINQLGYNAVLKIDDKDFDATNPGVWCHNVHSLQRRSRFTDWDQYIKDEVLK